MSYLITYFKDKNKKKIYKIKFSETAFEGESICWSDKKNGKKFILGEIGKQIDKAYHDMNKYIKTH